LLRAFAGFGLGVLAWRFDASRALHALSPRMRSAAAAVSVILVAATMARDGQEMLTLPAFAFLLVGLSVGGTLTQRILNAPIFFTLGYLSYSVYLIHDQLHPLRRLLERTAGQFLATEPAHLLALGLTLAAGYALAALAYRFVEGPARVAVLRRWRGRQVPGKTPQPRRANA
jgi:peptidoglycan/LPS O-acetylase OafA/YrhL